MRAYSVLGALVISVLCCVGGCVLLRLKAMQWDVGGAPALFRHIICGVFKEIRYKSYFS